MLQLHAEVLFLEVLEDWTMGMGVKVWLGSNLSFLPTRPVSQVALWKTDPIKPKRGFMEGKFSNVGGSRET